MDKSPYSVLGIDENASLEEVKKAYRKKARENHPDLNPNDPKAAERMNEINEAYDRITNPEKYAKRTAASSSNPYGSSSAGSSSGGYSGSGSAGEAGNNPYGNGPTGQDGQYSWVGGFGFGFDDIFGGMGGGPSGPIHPEANASDSGEVRQAIEYINSKRYKDAVSLLSSIPSGGRDARWHYLIALANDGAGNSMLAHDQIRKALEMDPNNPDYKQAYRQMQRPGATYQQTGQQQGFNTATIISPAAICCCVCLMTQFCRMARYGIFF